jgi:hypothetical protein
VNFRFGSWIQSATATVFMKGVCDAVVFLKKLFETVSAQSELSLPSLSTLQK